MPPHRAGRKRKSGASTISTATANTDSKIQASHFPMPPTALVSTKTGETPMQSPLINSAMKKKMVLTATQKQALMDNLQLEITERARKLRAQYALQAQGLRTRLEIRIHRIPTALRKAKMSDLLARYEAEARGEVVPVPTKMNRQRASPDKQIHVDNAEALQPPQRGIKRASDQMDLVSEKENLPHEESQPVKRLRTSGQNKPGLAAASTNAGSSRKKIESSKSNQQPAAGRRHVPASQVLSPKSNNSRNLPPQSPFKSPFKPAAGGVSGAVSTSMSRPGSPLKPSVTVPTASSLAKTAATKPVGRPKTATGVGAGVGPGPRAASRAAAAPKSATIGAAAGRKAKAQALTMAPATGKPTISVVVNTEEDFYIDPDAVEDGARGRTSDASEMTNASAGTTIVTKKKGVAGAAVPGAGTGVRKTGTANKTKSAGAMLKAASTTGTSNSVATAAPTAAAMSMANAEKKKRGGIAGTFQGISAKGKKVASAVTGAASATDKTLPGSGATGTGTVRGRAAVGKAKTTPAATATTAGRTLRKRG